MNLAVIGSGGREHSICYKLKQSNKINKIICIPGNAGTQALAENINIDIKNFKEILKIIKIELTLFVILTFPRGRIIDLSLRIERSSFNSLFRVGEINLF